MNCFDGTFSMGKAFALAGAVGKALRNVANFNGVSQYAVAPRVEEITKIDYAFEIEWSSELTGADGVVLSQVSRGNDAIGARTLLLVEYKTKSELRLDVLGSISTFSLVDYTSGHNYRIVSDGSTTVTLYVDGVVHQSVQITPPTFGTDSNARLVIGALTDNVGTHRLLYQGQLRDIKIWTGGDRNTGTLTRYYRMREGWRGTNNQVLVNDAAELGEELVVNGDFSDGLDGWSRYGGNPLPEVIDGVAIGNTIDRHFLQQGLPSASPRLYEVSVTDKSVGTTVVETRAAGLGVDVKWEGTYYHVEGVPRSNVLIKEYQAESSMAINSVSVRQADGYGSYVGLTEASWTEEIA